MIADTAWRERMARNGRAWIEDHYDVVHVAKAWTPLLQNIYVGINETIVKSA